MRRCEKKKAQQTFCFSFSPSLSLFLFFRCVINPSSITQSARSLYTHVHYLQSLQTLSFVPFNSKVRYCQTLSYRPGLCLSRMLLAVSFFHTLFHSIRVGCLGRTLSYLHTHFKSTGISPSFSTFSPCVTQSSSSRMPSFVTDSASTHPYAQSAWGLLISTLSYLPACSYQFKATFSGVVPLFSPLPVSVTNFIFPPPFSAYTLTHSTCALQYAFTLFVPHLIYCVERRLGFLFSTGLFCTIPFAALHARH